MVTAPTTKPATMADIKPQQTFRTTAGWATAITVTPTDDGIEISHRPVGGGTVFTTTYRPGRTTAIRLA